MPFGRLNSRISAKSCLLVLAMANAALLGGCVTASKVMPAGNGLYVIKGRAVGPWNGDKERKQALKKANAYCAKQSQRVLLHNINETGHSALLGEHATIVFECET